MSNLPRRKGTRAETDVVAWLQRNGAPAAERHALHGNRDIGDITGVPGLVVSVKFVGPGKPMDLSGWINELRVMVDNATVRTQRFVIADSADPPWGLLVVRRPGHPSPGEWYAVQTLGDWWDMYRETLV